MLINPEAKAELDKAHDHLEAALMLMTGDMKYKASSTLYDFMYRYNPEDETIYGKMWAIGNVMLSILTDFQPDPAE